MQLLGLCPLLAVTGSAVNAIGLGLATTLVLVCSNTAVSLIRNVVSDAVRLPAFVMIIAATAASFVFGAPVVQLAETSSIAWVQAFVSGSLIHIVAFGVSHDHDAHIEPVAQFQDWGYRVGILLGLFLVFTTPQLHA